MSPWGHRLHDTGECRGGTRGTTSRELSGGDFLRRGTEKLVVAGGRCGAEGSGGGGWWEPLAGGDGQWVEGGAGLRGLATSSPWEIMHRKGSLSQTCGV